MKLKNLFTVMLSTAIAFSLTACGLFNKKPSNGSSEQNTSQVVTIESLAAAEGIYTEETSAKSVRYAARLLADDVEPETSTTGESSEEPEDTSEETSTTDPVEPGTSDESSTGESSEDPVEEPKDNIQYIVVYRSSQDIKFTITLDNPEGYGIDAIRLYCDDPEAQISVEGTYEKIAKEKDGTRVVNWSSEDAYKKTYNIKLSSEEYVNSLIVKDIRLAGHEKFQSKEVDVKSLGKNELKVFKMADEDLKWNFVANTTEYYEWNFATSDKISNLVVKVAEDNVDGEAVLEAQDGKYKVEKNCRVHWAYDFTYEGVTVKWEDSKEIELVKVIYEEVESSILFGNPNDCSLYFMLNENPTDVDTSSFIVIKNDVEYTFTKNIVNGNMVRYTCNSHVANGDNDFDFVIVIGNGRYTIVDSKLVLSK